MANTDEVTLHLTPDEAAMLYRGYVSGIPGGNASVHQSLTMKLERAKSGAQGRRALSASRTLNKDKGISNGAQEIVV